MIIIATVEIRTLTNGRISNKMNYCTVEKNSTERSTVKAASKKAYGECRDIIRSQIFLV